MRSVKDRPFVLGALGAIAITSFACGPEPDADDCAASSGPTERTTFAAQTCGRLGAESYLAPGQGAS